MKLMKLALLATIATLSDAYFFLSPPRTSYELWYDYYEPPRESAPSPYWTASTDAYELKLRLPDLEPQSITAALSSDGTKIEVAGERKIDGCTCQPTTVKELSLPYRPRPEDVDVSIGTSGVLSLRLARNNGNKVDAPTPLAVKVLEAPSTTSTDNKEAREEPGTRPLRFIPHASAAESSSSNVASLEQQEKSLTDKFRSAASAAVSQSAKESTVHSVDAAAAAVGSNDPQGVPPPSTAGNAKQASTA